MLSSLHFIFYLLTNKRAVLSSAQTDQSQFSFPASFQHEIEHALSGASFWHQKNLAPEKYDRLTSNWCQKEAPETGQCVITISHQQGRDTHADTPKHAMFYRAKKPLKTC